MQNPEVAEILFTARETLQDLANTAKTKQQKEQILAVAAKCREAFLALLRPNNINISAAKRGPRGTALYCTHELYEPAVVWGYAAAARWLGATNINSMSVSLCKRIAKGKTWAATAYVDGNEYMTAVRRATPAEILRATKAAPLGDPDSGT